MTFPVSNSRGKLLVGLALGLITLALFLPSLTHDFIRYDDFRLWVDLPDGTHGAVTPVSPRGSGDGRVRLIYARHGTPEGDAVAEAQAERKAVILPPDHELAQQAFARQV